MLLALMSEGLPLLSATCLQPQHDASPSLPPNRLHCVDQSQAVTNQHSQRTMRRAALTRWMLTSEKQDTPSLQLRAVRSEM
jgi:hypothetical protein